VRVTKIGILLQRDSNFRIVKTKSVEARRYRAESKLLAGWEPKTKGSEGSS